MLEVEWVADTQLQLSQLSYLDATNDEQQEEVDDGPGSQAQPLEISSNNEIDGEPRRSGRVKKATRVIESQQWQIDQGLIPAPGARARARALNAKKKKNTETSQLRDEFDLIE
jgi:hypothetical protein